MVPRKFREWGATASWIYRVSSTFFVVPVLIALGIIWACGVELSVLDDTIETHQSLLISLGTLLLVSVLAVWATHLANTSAEKRERSNRKVQAELQIAQFRQAWIAEIGRDISEFIFLSSKQSKGDQVDSRIMHLATKVLMQLNLDEELAEDLRAAMLALIDTDNAAGNAALATQASSNYLKAEWKRLKLDLQNAQSLEHY